MPRRFILLKSTTVGDLTLMFFAIQEYCSRCTLLLLKFYYTLSYSVLLTLFMRLFFPLIFYKSFLRSNWKIGFNHISTWNTWAVVRRTVKIGLGAVFVNTTNCSAINRSWYNSSVKSHMSDLAPQCSEYTGEHHSFFYSCSHVDSAHVRYIFLIFYTHVFLLLTSSLERIRHNYLLEVLENARPFCLWLDGTECVLSFSKGVGTNRNRNSPLGYQCRIGCVDQNCMQG